MSREGWRPLVIVGAPRSGTNLLRDLLCQAPGFGTWPCDEINLLWCHGNAGFPDDALPPALATPGVVRHMRRRFADIARTTGADTVVEKTCANSLRVAFVDRVLPEARYLFILRDGRDAVASAARRFSAPIDWTYTLRKLRYAPASDLPAYALRYARNRATRLLRSDRRLAYWGPRFPGFADFARAATVPEICARQWRECVELAARDFALLGPRRVHELRYESLVRRPRDVLGEVFAFLGAPGAAAAVDVRHVSAAGIGRGRLGDGGGRALAWMKPALARFGYD
jgi:Sulfotransferase family